MALLFATACDGGPPAPETAHKWLLEDQGFIDRIREEHREKYAEVMREWDRVYIDRRKTADEKTLEKIKVQLETRVRLIEASLMRFKIDKILLEYTLKREKRILAALISLRRAKAERPKKLSHYITSVEFAEFEDETGKMLKRDREGIAHWEAESKKWRESWDAGKLDYNPTELKRPTFRFDYDNGPETRKNLMKSLESGLETLKKEAVKH